MNFLEQHYTDYREAGGDHISYVVLNDISDELGAKLEKMFEASHPNGVAPEVCAAFRKRVDEEVTSAKAADDLEWLLGIGRYGQ